MVKGIARLPESLIDVFTTRYTIHTVLMGPDISQVAKH